VRDGNSLYAEKKYSDAELKYRKALGEDPALVEGHYDLGNSLHRQGKFEDAVREYEATVGKTEGKEARSRAFYNIGNSFLRQQKYEEAVKAYIESLKLNPEDQEAKYNLSYALEMLKRPPPPEQKQKDKNDQDKKKDEQKKDDQKKDQPKQDQKKNQLPPREKKISQADAQRILDALQQNEKEIQKKLRVRQAVRPKGEKDW
jgi:tetratricopeptide (TPR) repeat protein